jgi:phage shock protein E
MGTRYQKLVADAKSRIEEISAQEAATKLESGEATLIDVRDDEDWKVEHAPKAMHLTRGALEGEIEDVVPDVNAAIVCHCGGGGRSALAVESLQKMGYKNVRSMAGGLKAWKAAGLPTVKG